MIVHVCRETIRFSPSGFSAFVCVAVDLVMLFLASAIMYPVVPIVFVTISQKAGEVIGCGLPSSTER